MDFEKRLKELDEKYSSVLQQRSKMDEELMKLQGEGRLLSELIKEESGDEKEKACEPEVVQEKEEK